MTASHLIYTHLHGISLSCGSSPGSVAKGDICVCIYIYVTRSPKMRRNSFLGESEVWLKSHSALYSDEIGAKIIAILPKLAEICLPKGRNPRKCISEKLAIKR